MYTRSKNEKKLSSDPRVLITVVFQTRDLLLAICRLIFYRNFDETGNIFILFLIHKKTPFFWKKKLQIPIIYRRRVFNSDVVWFTRKCVPRRYKFVFTAFIDMPEMLYYMRSNYQYWKDLEEKGTISFSDICKMSLTTTLPKIPESSGQH